MQALPGTLKDGIPSKADLLHKVIQTVVYNYDRESAQIFVDFLVRYVHSGVGDASHVVINAA